MEKKLFNGVVFVNLTPHPINIVKGEEVITFPPSGTVARVSTEVVEVKHIGGIETVCQSFGKIEGIELEKDEIGIVSSIVLSAAKEIEYQNIGNLVSPNTNNAIRNENGHIIGVPGFSVNTSNYSISIKKMKMLMKKLNRDFRSKRITEDEYHKYANDILDNSIEEDFKEFFEELKLI